MSKNQDIFIILILLFFFCIGVWEANIASNNDSDYNYYSNSEEEGYVFTTIKSIINILSGLFGTILFLIRRNVDDLFSSGLNRVYCINLLITIWCIVMFSEIINNNSDFGEFKQVIIVEFIIFITCISMVVFLYCFYGVCACIINNQINNLDTNQKNDLEIDNTQPEELIEIIITK